MAAVEATGTEASSTPSAGPLGPSNLTPDLNLSNDNSLLSSISRYYLQCPVCLDVCRIKPIYQCHNGHTICKTCIKRLTNCPVCRCFLGVRTERIRNLALEFMLDNIDVNCPYENKGCAVKVKSCLLKQHLLECQFGKFIICPALGFESCQERVCTETMFEHVSRAHRFQTCESNSQKIRITYVDFLSTKTMKDGGFLKWDPLLVSIFPDTGPFLFMCHLDVQQSCSATFACVYAPINVQTLEDNEVAADEISSMNSTYFVQVAINHQDNFTIPVNFKWEGQTISYKDYLNGSKTGVFEIALDRFRMDPNEVDQQLRDMRQARLQNILNIIQDDTTPPPPGTAPNDNTLDERNRMFMSAAFSNPPASSRRRIRTVRQDLIVEIRIAKTSAELAQPWTGTFQQCGQHRIVNYTVEKTAATYRGVKCDECADPIRGMRFKCMECRDYDLCFRCRVKKKHHSHHVFLLIDDTDQNARVTKRFKRVRFPQQDPS